MWPDHHLPPLELPPQLCCLYSSSTKLLLDFFYIPGCFTLLCLCSCIPVALEYPLGPSISTFKILFSNQLLWREFLNSTPLPLSEMLLLQFQEHSGHCIPLFFNLQIRLFIPLPPSFTWEFFQGRNCVILIFITLMPGLDKTSSKFSKPDSELNTFSLHSKYLLTNCVIYFPEARE